MRDDGLTVARRLVADLFPEALAAWLGGSVASGTATASSDLDITVLLPGPPAPYRHSIGYDGWPVELFVHTSASVEHYVAKDIARRQPTMPRLVTGVLLLDVDGSGAAISARAAEVVAAGPPPLSRAELDACRYLLSDLLDDLVAPRSEAERVAVAVRLWEGALGLFLTGAGRWTGTGKGLVREVTAVDPVLADRSVAALRAALAGEVEELVAMVDDVLAAYGGRLFEGYRVGGEKA